MVPAWTLQRVVVITTLPQYSSPVALFSVLRFIDAYHRVTHVTIIHITYFRTLMQHAKCLCMEW